MSRYLIGSTPVEHPGAATALLSEAHAAKTRPLCLCVPDGIPMYIARAASGFLIKRMPCTGETHDPACESYEPPAELSGLAPLLGTAIRENPDGGTDLKLDFPLRRDGKHAPAASTGQQPGSIKSTGTKLTLRGLLHYLWDQAGLSRWTPRFAGKRSWGVVRRLLLEAADGKATKGDPLVQRIYIPETFNLDHKADIAQRRAAAVAPAAAPAKGPRPLMILIAELVAMEPVIAGRRLVFKHLRDLPFFMDEPLARRFQKRFEDELTLTATLENTHAMTIATFGLSAAGVPSIEEISVMPVTANWIPFEHHREFALIAAMTEAARPFVKCPRYNLDSTAPLASLLDTSTRPPTAMFIPPDGVSEEAFDRMRDASEAGRFPAWLWQPGTGMPDLPGAPA